MATIDGASPRGVAKFTYDFAARGGAVSVIELTGDDIPDNAIVWDGCVDVLTAFAGAGATAALHINAANDLVTATAFDAPPWSSATVQAIVPVGTVATCIKLTAFRHPTLTITGAPLTAGKFNLFLQYFLSD